MVGAAVGAAVGSAGAVVGAAGAAAGSAQAVKERMAKLSTNVRLEAAITLFDMVDSVR
jgi:hypothetical protein